jgi:hypothetical protein
MGELFELAGIEYELPSQGDRLFNASLCNKEISLEANGRTLAEFVWSYTNAVEALVRLPNDRLNHPRRMIWPILALCRQVIELALKKCIFDATEYLDGEGMSFAHHDLRKLKGALFQRMKQLDLAVDDDMSAGFFGLLDDLADADPDAAVFRYPTDKSGKPRKLAFDSIDIDCLRRGTSKMLLYLDALSETINQKATVWD